MATGGDIGGLEQHGPALHRSTVGPAPVLRACAVGPAGTYQWPRYLQYDGMLMGPLAPQRGSVAGSAGATFEAKMALLPMMGEEMGLRGDANSMLSLHVDDPSQHQWGDTMLTVLHEMKEHVRRVGHRLQKELGLPLATHKLNVVTSSGMMTEMARAMLGKLGGPGEYGLRNLGIDYAGGKHRSHPKAHTT
eukprot:1073916-Pyramimonas_sp.AAC.1